MTLIDNWKEAPKMWAVQVFAAIAAVQVIWTQLPPDLLKELPANLSHYVTLAFTTLGVIARVLSQDNITPTPKAGE